MRTIEDCCAYKRGSNTLPKRVAKFCWRAVTRKETTRVRLGAGAPSLEVDRPAVAERRPNGRPRTGDALRTGGRVPVVRDSGPAVVASATRPSPAKREVE